MTPRRAPHPGQLSLFGPAVASATPAPAPREPSPEMAPRVVDGRAILPLAPGEEIALRWECIRDPAGEKRDALAVLRGTVFRGAEPVAIVCPLFGRRWNKAACYARDCDSPFADAFFDHATAIVGVRPPDLFALFYTWHAAPHESRPVLRGEPPRCSDGYWRWRAAA